MSACRPAGWRVSTVLHAQGGRRRAAAPRPASAERPRSRRTRPGRTPHRWRCGSRNPAQLCPRTARPPERTRRRHTGCTSCARPISPARHGRAAGDGGSKSPQHTHTPPRRADCGARGPWRSSGGLGPRPARCPGAVRCLGAAGRRAPPPRPPPPPRSRVAPSPPAGAAGPPRGPHQLPLQRGNVGRGWRHAACRPSSCPALATVTAGRSYPHSDRVISLSRSRARCWARLTWRERRRSSDRLVVVVVPCGGNMALRQG